ncbi:MAG: histidine kinase [Bacteroidota bacterium]
MELTAQRDLSFDRWRYIGFNDTWFIIMGIPLISLFLSLLFFSESTDSWQMFARQVIGGMPFTAMYWICVRYCMLYLRQKYDSIEHTMRRLVTIALIILTVSPFLGGCLNLLLDFLAELVNYERIYSGRQENKVLPTYFACFFMVAIYEAIYFYYQLKQSITEREQAKQEQIKSELAGLRNQVNPHFLFNSMNTLMNIVLEDQQLAVHFLRKLSKVYRYVLENREEQIIPLRKELDFIHSYVFLQKERFKGNLEVVISVDDSQLEHHIIPLSLQILFENAIKHNVISRKKPLKIEVFVENGKLVVRNNLQRKEQIMDSTKVGLQNIKTRYQFFTEESVCVEESNQFFTVAIPLLVH